VTLSVKLGFHLVLVAFAVLGTIPAALGHWAIGWSVAGSFDQLFSAIVFYCPLLVPVLGMGDLVRRVRPTVAVSLSAAFWSHWAYGVSSENPTFSILLICLCLAALSLVVLSYRPTHAPWAAA
jgi:hypothetical protein